MSRKNSLSENESDNESVNFSDQEASEDSVFADHYYVEFSLECEVDSKHRDLPCVFDFGTEEEYITEFEQDFDDVPFDKVETVYPKCLFLDSWEERKVWGNEKPTNYDLKIIVV